MAHTAFAVVRTDGEWHAGALDLAGLAELDEAAERLRDLEPEADLCLAFVEADDQYWVVMRMDDGDDLRVFCSDAAFATESRLGAVLLADLDITAPEIQFDDGEDEDEQDRPLADAEADPVGDVELLADLGLPARQLLELCNREGLLPADVTAEVCQAIGAGDEVEELREA
jgi:putative tRNA adenosine deaminase-associated protein